MLTISLSASAQGAHTCRSIPIIVNIDVPPGDQTQPVAISNSGWITGGYRGADGRNHCFLRSPGASYSNCEPPGVGAVASFAWSINAAGQIAGVYKDAGNVYHGFVRNGDGTFVAPLDAPGAGTGSDQGTIGYDINPAAEVAGQSIDGNGVYHSWVWNNGNFTVFDAPGAGTESGQGTQPSTVDGLNPMGVLAGNTLDDGNAFHGYLRAADGTITVFDVPGAGTGEFQGTEPGGINQAGTIEGAYVDDNGVSHGFLRAANGNITTYDVPGGGTGPGQGTQNGNINALGEITSAYIDANNVSHGFVREPNGTITRFDAPGAGTAGGQGTFPYCNNASGQVTGWYVDNLGTLHGFLRTCH